MRKVWLITLAFTATTTLMMAQSMNKKHRTFEVSRELPFSADKVWKAVADDYGNIANAHPKIIASEYAEGSLKGEKGAQRMCYFNEKQTQLLHEQIVDWNPEEMTFVNRVLETKKFPLDTENTRATYRVEAIGPNKARISMKMEFRTKPAFMGFMAQGQFKGLLKDYFIALEHHLRTGESVTGNNFKAIKREHNYTR